jgi:ribosomal-protein-alanine N-acetyltransferase
MIPLLETNRLILRPYNLSDDATVEKLANHSLIADTTLNIPHPYPKGAAAGWISSHEDQAINNKSYTFAIVLRETEELLGSMTIRFEKNNKAELAYWIGVPFWGKGYATEAARRLLQYGFEEKQLNKIFAAAFTRNPASSKVMEKIGMTYEGTFKQHAQKNNGQYEDLAFFAILKEEYL